MSCVRTRPPTACVVCQDRTTDKLVARQTVAAMRDVTDYAEDYFFVTYGGAALGDSLGKKWYFDSTSMAVDDGTPETVVIRFSAIPDTSPGRLLQFL